MPMDGNEKDEIEIIREVFTYIHRYRGAVFVIKIDYEVIDNTYFPVLLNDLATLHGAGIRIIIIPGARKRIDEILEQYSIPTVFKDGVRITDEKAIPFVKMAAFDVSNRIMTGLSGLKINALVGNWIRARSIGIIDGVDYMHSGMVDRVLLEPLLKVLDDYFIPIVPIIGWNPVGKSYNLSSDDLAVQLAGAVGAEKLFFISSEETLRVKDFIIPKTVVSAPDGRLSRMDEAAAEEFVSLNTEKFDRLAVIVKALDGVRKGIKRVHILNGKEKGGILSEIFSNLGIGTMVYRNEFDRIRAMDTGDIPEVLRLMQPFVQEGILIPRDKQKLQDSIEDFIVYETDKIIHGCACLHLYPEGIGEIAAVAVDPEYEKLGIGRKLISYLMERGVQYNLRMLFLLTTRTGDWFESLGFHAGDLDDLPKEKRKNYSFDRNSRIMVLNLEK